MSPICRGRGAFRGERCGRTWLSRTVTLRLWLCCMLLLQVCVALAPTRAIATSVITPLRRLYGARLDTAQDSLTNLGSELTRETGRYLRNPPWASRANSVGPLVVHSNRFFVLSRETKPDGWVVILAQRERAHSIIAIQLFSATGQPIPTVSDTLARSMETMYGIQIPDLRMSRAWVRIVTDRDTLYAELTIRH